MMMGKKELLPMDPAALRTVLNAMAEPEFRAFTSRLLPGTKNILGVRLPKLRKLAKRIAKGDWRAYLGQCTEDSFEEIMLQGMVLGYLDAPLRERLSYVEDFLPKIDNWSVCDSFCSGLKIARDFPQEVWVWLLPYLSGGGEFVVRFAVVMLLTYYLDEKYIDQVLVRLDGVNHPGYYVKMAVAWAVSVCYVKFPEITHAFLRTACPLDDFTYNKALQKTIESRRIDDGMRHQLRAMKRKKAVQP